MLSERQRDLLRQTARRAIEYGIGHGREPELDGADFDERLRQDRASFVTLKRGGQLRGCIGMLQPCRPLFQDVASNAFAAAFHDSRFTPLQANELDDLEIHISILNPPEPLPCTSERELVSQLRKGEDGIILSEHGRRATFLPSVWESIDDGGEFIRHLKLKAGLPADHWSDAIEVQRYTVDEF